MQADKTGNRALESAIAKLRSMSQESKVLIIPLIDKLAEAEGVSPGTEFKPPLENLGHWLTKLRSERKSERTIRLYSYLAGRLLKQLPSTTRADLREYLAN
jgi:primosomal protein N''